MAKVKRFRLAYIKCGDYENYLWADVYIEKRFWRWSRVHITHVYDSLGHTSREFLRQNFWINNLTLEDKEP